MQSRLTEEPMTTAARTSKILATHVTKRPTPMPTAPCTMPSMLVQRPRMELCRTRQTTAPSMPLLAMFRMQLKQPTSMLETRMNVGVRKLSGPRQ